MKLREHIDAFRLYLSDSTGRPSDDITHPNRLIGYEIVSAANATLKSIDKKELKLIAPTICISLKEADIVECPCAPSSGCTYMRSILSIPEIMGLPIDISFADASKTYTYIEWNKMQHALSSRTQAVKQGSYYTFKKLAEEIHLYVYHRKDVTSLKTVQVTAIPLDPIEWAKADCNGAKFDCNPMDVQLTIPETYRPQVFQAVMQKLGVVLQIQGGKPDLINDDIPKT
jgi:hypothetical protein